LRVRRSSSPPPFSCIFLVPLRESSSFSPLTNLIFAFPPSRRRQTRHHSCRIICDAVFFFSPQPLLLFPFPLRSQLLPFSCASAAMNAPFPPSVIASDSSSLPPSVPSLLPLSIQFVRSFCSDGGDYCSAGYVQVRSLSFFPQEPPPATVEPPSKALPPSVSVL